MPSHHFLLADPILIVKMTRSIVRKYPATKCSGYIWWDIPWGAPHYSGQIRAMSQTNGGMGGTHGKVYELSLEELVVNRNGGFLRNEIWHFLKYDFSIGEE